MSRRVLVTGSRTWDLVPKIQHELRMEMGGADWDAVLVCGMAHQGADEIAATYWGDFLGGRVEEHPAYWDGVCDPAFCRPGHRRAGRGGSYCPSAGIRRNQVMVDRGADICLAFLRDNSRGTLDCIQRARRAGIYTLVFDYDDYSGKAP
jgi:hypothetical protein